MEQIKIESLLRERETKNTIRFAEETTEDQAQAVGALYVQQRALRPDGKGSRASVGRYDSGYD